MCASQTMHCSSTNTFALVRQIRHRIFHIYVRHINPRHRFLPPRPKFRARPENQLLHQQPCQVSPLGGVQPRELYHVVDAIQNRLIVEDEIERHRSQQHCCTSWHSLSQLHQADWCRI